MKLETYFVYFIIIWLAALAPAMYWEVMTLDVTHTYVLPSAGCTGRLTSNRGDFQTIRECLLVVAYLIFPWTLALMMYTRERIGWIFHVLVGLVVFVWLAINFIYDLSDITSANVAPDDPNFRFVNYARSDDWCILYGGQPGTQLLCTNIAPCSGPGVLVENLKPNNDFLFRFGINAFYTLFTLMILFYSAFQWEYGVKTIKNT